MTIASQKKEENIVEYIIYLWQMEDLVRAAKLDLAAIRAFLDSSGQELDIDSELSWFAELIQQMKSQKVQQKGHVSEVGELLIEMSYLHHSLISITKDKMYIASFDAAEPNLSAFLERAGNSGMNPVEASITALYGLLNLRLQKKEISPDTLGAMKSFQHLMALLANHYRKMKLGTMDVSLN
ncbi:MAG: hypothetical protein ACJAU0_000373 [Flavobacteriales bacterium]|jgi:hypothetical protein